MALSRLLRPLHTGASRMQSVIEQCHRSGHLHAASAADDSSVFNPAINHRANLAGNEQSVITRKDAGQKTRERHGHPHQNPHY